MPHYRDRRLRGSILLFALVCFALNGLGARLPLAGAVDRRAVAAASAAPIVGPAHAVSTPVQSSAPGSQTIPAVAWDGTNFFVVWEDVRAPTARDIFGARVSPNGTVLDPTGILISTAAGDQGAPTIAWNGTNFLVVWQEPRAETDYDVVGARVSPAGTVLDPAGIPIATGDTLLAPSVASNGSNFLVVFQANVGGATSIRATRVSGAGAVLDDPAINVSSAPNGRGDPAVASNGSAYFVVWADSRSDPADIYGARVSAAGSVGDPNGIALTTASGGQGEPSVAWNGSTYLVVWSDGDISGTRVSSTGTVLDSSGISISTAVSTQGAPSVGSLGSQFFVAWNDYRSGSSFIAQIFGARVGANGTVLDANGIAISDSPNGGDLPAVAGGTTNVLVTWQGATANFASSDIFAARVAAGAVAGPHGFLVSGAADSQTSPRVAFDGRNFLVVWTGLRGGEFHVFGARVTPSGTRLDGSGFAIANGAVPQTAPAIVWNGHRFLVVWEQAGAIYGARVTKAGTVVDAHGFRISSGVDAQPDVSWNGEDFLVVWQHAVDPETRRSNIVGSRVSRAGVVLDPLGIVIAPVGQTTDAAVASNGSSSLVVWQDRSSGDAHVLRALVTNGGDVLQPNGIPITTAAGDQFQPDVASSGTGFQVVWADTRNGNGDIFGTRVSSSGKVIDTNGIPISTAPSPQSSPVIAFNRRFLVLWVDRRNDPGGDIYATRLHLGAAQDVSGFVVAGSGAGETEPAVSAGPSDDFGGAYQRYVVGAPYNAYRAFLRTVAPK